MILKERLYFPQIVYVSSLIFFSLLLFLSSILDFIVNLHKIIFIVGFWPWIILVIWQQLCLLIFFVVILFFIFLIKWIIWSLLIFLHQHGKKKVLVFVIDVENCCFLQVRIWRIMASSTLRRNLRNKMLISRISITTQRVISSQCSGWNLSCTI